MAGLTSASVISPGSAWPFTPTLGPKRSQGQSEQALLQASHLACHWSCAQSHVPGRGFSRSLRVREVRRAVSRAGFWVGAPKGRCQQSG